MKLIYGLFFCLNARGQLSHIVSETAYMSSAAYSKHFRDAFSFASNPACLGTVQNFRSGILAERKWMLKELDSYEMAASFPLGNGGLGIAMLHSGDVDYSEQELSLSYGKNLGHVQLGMSFSYLTARSAGYGGTGFGYSGIGICFPVSEKWIAGWEIGLPVFSIAGKASPEKGPEFFKMGFGYETRPDLFLSLQIEKAAGLPVNVIAYIEYRYNEQFFFAFGINSLAASPYFKSGWKKNNLCIQIYTMYEPVLGFCPGLVFLIEGKSKKG